MKEVALKNHLIRIADSLTQESTIEDVFEQLALLADIDEFEKQVSNGEVVTHSEVLSQSKEWLR